MDVIVGLLLQGVQMLLVLALAPLLAGLHPYGQGAHAAPARPAHASSPIATSSS